MNVTPLPIARVTNQLQSSALLGSLQGNQLDLLKVQQQISTGQRLTSASDDPVAASGIDSLNRQLSGLTQYNSNLNFASTFLNTADSSLSSLTSLLTQAQGIASSDVNSTASPDQRSADASVIDSILSQTLNISNSKYLGQSIFGGQNGTKDAFAGAAGGYLYQGSTTSQGILTPNGDTVDYTINGNQVFGGLSSQVAGYKNLAPGLDPTTLLSDMKGQQGTGIHLGTISASDGTTTINIDLSKAATVGDVLNTVNTALTNAGIAGSVGISGFGIPRFAGASTPLTFSDVGTGTTSADLGLTGTVPAGANFGGTNLQPALTPLTKLLQLNDSAGISYAGLQITNGTTSATIAVNGNMTVQGLINAINGSGTYTRAEINSTGDGINVYNALSGTKLSIGENGGTTAQDLGIRSFQPLSQLSGFNGGAGVTPIAGTIGGQTGDISFTTTSGGTFNVKTDGVSNVTQLIAAINGATGNSTVTAALNATGNGITLTDSSGGSGNLSATPAANYISNGTNLGFLTTGSGGTLSSTGTSFSTDDFQITRKDGVKFNVLVAGAKTVQDVLNAINNAPGNAGAVAASMDSTGNGISLTDGSIGSGLLTVTPVNSSSAAAQLGIYQTAASATPGKINGTDTNPMIPSGVFSSLIALRDALRSNNTQAITAAAASLTADSQRVIAARGVVGARSQDISSRQDQNSTDQTNLKKALSLLADTDMTTAISQFSLLQTAYQATLKVSQATTGLTLLDFLK